MSDCVFCKLVNKEFPRATVYEDDAVIAIIPTGYVNKGHVLVIPKNHAVTLLDAEESDLCECMKAIKKVAKAVKESTNCDGINLYQNNFPASGQEVPHVHFHIIPRFKDDGLKLWGLKQDYEENEMNQIADNIKRFL